MPIARSRCAVGPSTRRGPRNLSSFSAHPARHLQRVVCCADGVIRTVAPLVAGDTTGLRARHPFTV